MINGLRLNYGMRGAMKARGRVAVTRDSCDPRRIGDHASGAPATAQLSSADSHSFLRYDAVGEARPAATRNCGEAGFAPGAVISGKPHDQACVLSENPVGGDFVTTATKDDRSQWNANRRTRALLRCRSNEL